MVPYACGLVLITLYQIVFEILQTLKEPGCTVIEKNSIEEVHLPMDGSDDCSQRYWRNVILEHMYRSSSVDETCIRGCIRKALVFNHGTDGTMVVKVTKVAVFY